ncbi:hypothetical protein FACS1894199_04710 [Bacteroidia bacterium]|nr:hypothetical protein FACS1894199_04710 [Bacteroidia bacterium]
MVANFSDCFTLRDGAINTEVLFQLNGDNGVSYNNNLEKGYFWELEGWDGWSWYFPTQDLVAAFLIPTRVCRKTILNDSNVVTAHGGGVDIVALLSGDYYGDPRTFVRPKHYFFPLPQDQIDRTNGVLTQNPAYQ